MSNYQALMVAAGNNRTYQDQHRQLHTQESFLHAPKIMNTSFGGSMDT